MKRLAILWLALCAACIELHAQETLVIGTEDIEYYPHYGRAHDGDGEFAGYARELFERFAAESSLAVDYHPMPIKRLYQSLMVDGTIDFKYPDNANWQKALHALKPVYYSDPVGYYMDGVMVHSDRREMSLSELRVLGIMRGFTPEPYLQAINEGRIQIREYSKTGDMLRALLAKRVDAAYLNIDVANYQLQQKFEAGAPIEYLPKLPSASGEYRLSTVKHPAIIRQFNQFLRANPRLKGQLARKYRIQPEGQ